MLCCFTYRVVIPVTLLTDCDIDSNTHKEEGVTQCSLTGCCVWVHSISYSLPHCVVCVEDGPLPLGDCAIPQISSELCALGLAQLPYNCVTCENGNTNKLTVITSLRVVESVSAVTWTLKNVLKQARCYSKRHSGCLGNTPSLQQQHTQK